MTLKIKFIFFKYIDFNNTMHIGTVNGRPVSATKDEYTDSKINSICVVPKFILHVTIVCHTGNNH